MVDTNIDNVKRKILTIRNPFKATIDSGDSFSFSLSGWYHKRGEACDAFIIYTWFEETVIIDGTPELKSYKLDKIFQLLLLTRSRDVDCVVKTSKKFMDDTNDPDNKNKYVTVKRLLDGSLDVLKDGNAIEKYSITLNYDDIFKSRGSDCPEPNYYFNVFAKAEDKQKLDPDYLSLSVNSESKTIEIFFHTKDYS